LSYDDESGELNTDDDGNPVSITTSSNGDSLSSPEIDLTKIDFFNPLYEGILSDLQRNYNDLSIVIYHHILIVVTLVQETILWEIPAMTIITIRF
jgi:hypothetical protein